LKKCYERVRPIQARNFAPTPNIFSGYLYERMTVLRKKFRSACVTTMAVTPFSALNCYRLHLLRIRFMQKNILFLTVLSYCLWKSLFEWYVTGNELRT